MEELLLNAVAAFLGKTTDEVAELAKSDGADKKLLKLNADKVKEIKTTSFNEGAQDREAKLLTGIETKLKAKFGVDSTKKGDDLFEELAATAKNPNPETLTEAAVKASKFYVELEGSIEKKVKAAEKVLTDKLDQKDRDIVAEKTFDSVYSDGAKYLKDQLKPNLPKSAEVAATYENLFRESLRNGYEYEKLEGGGYVMKKDGKRLEDAQGNAVKFEDHIKGLSSKIYEFAEANPRSSTGNPSGTGGTGSNGSEPGKKFTGVLPTNEAEFIAIQINRALPSDQRAEVAEYWASNKT